MRWRQGNECPFQHRKSARELYLGIKKFLLDIITSSTIQAAFLKELMDTLNESTRKRPNHNRFEAGG
ncbi:hypothetical protein DKP78_26145, partial [Enterococcus faecium]